MEGVGGNGRGGSGGNDNGLTLLFTYSVLHLMVSVRLTNSRGVKDFFTILSETEFLGGRN